MKPRGSKPRSPQPVTIRREAKARIPADVARRVRDGHPWIFSDALMGARVPGKLGGAVDVVDPKGHFVARALSVPDGKPALRVYSRWPDAPFDGAHVRRVVADCHRRRRATVDTGPRDCYRLVNGDSEGLPAVTVDRYADYVVITLTSEVAETYPDALIPAIRDELSPRGIYLRRRFRSAEPGRSLEGATLVHGVVAPTEVEVNEDRLRFWVDVTAPVGTGLFLDMREGRREVARLAPGQRVLNCFSYTGAFSAVAALSGASAVVSVDAAARAHGRARKNFGLNGLDPDKQGREFITGDTFAVLTRLADRRRQFDLLILDPPTFSSSKGRTFSSLRDYNELVAASLKITAPGGTLCVACNTAKLTFSDLDRAIGRGACRASRHLVVQRRVGQPPDFPFTPAFTEGDYLKFVVLKALD